MRVGHKLQTHMERENRKGVEGSLAQRLMMRTLVAPLAVSAHKCHQLCFVGEGIKCRRGQMKESNHGALAH